MKPISKLLIIALSAISLAHPAFAQTSSYPEVKVLVDADRAFVDRAGGPTAAGQAIRELVAQVDAIYRSQLGITVTLVGPHLWSGADPFDRSTQSALLASFSSYSETNYRSSYTYDVAHLLVAQVLSGEGGVAYPGSACGNISSAPYAYGLSQPDLSDTFQFSPHLFAHELGHNLNASHDSLPGCSKSTIMCEALIGGNFSAASRSEIAAYVASRSSAGCFALTSKVDPVSSVRIRISSSKNTLNYVISGGQNCSTLTIVGSPWANGFSSLFGYLQIGALHPAATSKGKSTKILGLSGSKKLYVSAFCDGQLAPQIVTLNSKKIKASRISSSQILVLRSLQRGFRATAH